MGRCLLLHYNALRLMCMLVRLRAEVYRMCAVITQIYKGQLSAVKVVCDRDVDNGSLNGALELALLTSISHPNIIQIHTYYAGEIGGPVRSRRMVVARMKNWFWYRWC